MTLEVFVTDVDLIKAAIAAREFAYAPYSGFCVGAALLSTDGTVYTGCNIENAAFTPGICAERTAFAKALSVGVRDFTAIAVAGWAKDGQPGYAYPCGVCRQVMMEFCDPKTFRVIVASGAEDFVEATLDQLLPLGFGPLDLGTAR
jgi:cytidine deaminase